MRSLISLGARYTGGPPLQPVLGGLQWWYKPRSLTLGNNVAIDTLPDYSSYGRDGTASSTARPLCITGGLNANRIARFDAVNDLISGGNAIAGTPALWVEIVWKKPPSNNTVLALSKHGTFAAADGEWSINLAESTNNRETLRIGNNNGSQHSTDAVNIIGSDNWKINTVVWSGGSNPAFYGNGVPLAINNGAGSWTGVATMPTSTYPLTIGFVSGFLSAAGGDVAEGLIYNRIPSAAELAHNARYLRREHFTTQTFYFGTSFFSGGSSGTDATNWRPIPTQVGPLLAGITLGSNFGVSGQHTPAMNANIAAQIATVYEPGFAKTFAHLSSGTNDLAFGVQTAAEAITDVRATIALVRSLGCYPLVHPITPRSDVGIRGDFEANRLLFNAYFFANEATDGFSIVPISSVMLDPGSNTNATNYLLDLVHPNNTGAGIIAVNAATVQNAL